MSTRVLHASRRGGDRPDDRVRRLARCLGLALVGCALLPLCGCVAREPPPLPRPPPRPDPGPGVIAVPSALIFAALDDAARRTRTKQAEIRIVLAEAVTWPDGSIGCPQPGMMYSQALVQGYRIVLEAEGETLNYHAGPMGAPTFCPAERVTAPVTGGYAAN